MSRKWFGPTTAIIFFFFFFCRNLRRCDSMSESARGERYANEGQPRKFYSTAGPTDGNRRGKKKNPPQVMIFTGRRLCEAALTLKQTRLDGRVVKLLCSPQRSGSHVRTQTGPASCFGSNHVGLICEGTSGIDSVGGLVLMSR